MVSYDNYDNAFDGSFGGAPDRAAAGTVNPQKNPDSAKCCSIKPRRNPRHLIGQEISYHNARSNELHALLRALPGEMSWEAEEALCNLIIRGYTGPTR